MTVMTAEKLRSLFDYNPHTGVFTRTSSRGKWKAGSEVGSLNGIGYIVINTFGQPQYAHRLAHLWMKGEWPTNNIDHIDGNRRNNAWSNLRDVRQIENTHNLKKAKSQNSSRLLGVTWHKGANKYMARICVGAKTIHLGLFVDPMDAHHAYIVAKRIHHAGNTL